MKIILESNKLKINKILKKTKAEMFENLKEGNSVLISIEVARVGGGYRGTYAPNMRIENLETKEYTHKTFNELPRILECFELIEC